MLAFFCYGCAQFTLFVTAAPRDDFENDVLLDIDQYEDIEQFEKVCIFVDIVFSFDDFSLTAFICLSFFHTPQSLSRCCFVECAGSRGYVLVREANASTSGCVIRALVGVDMSCLILRG